MTPIVLLALLAAGIAFVSSKGKPVSQTLHPKAGETWTITIRAVGGKIGTDDETQFRAVSAPYADLQSYHVNDAGDTVVVVLKYKKDASMTTNQLIAFTNAPTKGVMITDAHPA